MSNGLQKSSQQAMGTIAPAMLNLFDPVQFEVMQRLSRMYASSDLVPDNYKTVLKPYPVNATEAQIAAINLENQAAQNKAIANCMIGLELSARIGASPLMVMQNMVPIYGKPTWSAKFLIATVNTCGRFEPLQYRFTEKGMLGMVDFIDYAWDEHTRRKAAVKRQFDGKKIMDIECVAFTTKRGSKELLESSPISIRIAIQEGWYTKNGSKWQTMPKQMLMYRAASWWASAYAPDLSMGMRTTEEQQDIYTDYEDVTDSPAPNKEKEEHANMTLIGVDLAKGTKDATGVRVEQKPTETPTGAQKAPDKEEQPMNKEKPKDAPTAPATPTNEGNAVASPGF